jgi:hypothetical protein
VNRSATTPRLNPTVTLLMGGPRRVVGPPCFWSLAIASSAAVGVLAWLVVRLM